VLDGSEDSGLEGLKFACDEFQADDLPDEPCSGYDLIADVLQMLFVGELGI